MQSKTQKVPLPPALDTLQSTEKSPKCYFHVYGTMSPILPFMKANIFHAQYAHLFSG